MCLFSFHLGKHITYVDLMRQQWQADDILIVWRVLFSTFHASLKYPQVSARSRNLLSACSLTSRSIDKVSPTVQSHVDLIVTQQLAAGSRKMPSDSLVAYTCTLCVHATVYHPSVSGLRFSFLSFFLFSVSSSNLCTYCIST